jgi:ubiquinone/menaquinone biosynthesis C-methylase UbiE
MQELQRYKDQIRKRLVKYTRKAYQILPEMTTPRILDIGCGSGVPTIELAKLSGGVIYAIDTNQAMLDRLAKRTKRLGLETHVMASNCSMLNISYPNASFDIIWAEGSIAVIGFEKGITGWRPFLKPGGFLVVHDDADNLTEKLAQVSRCGFELKTFFILNEDIWWNQYYSPLKKKLDEIRARYPLDNKIATSLDNDKREIDGFFICPERYRSVFLIMKKT